MIKASLDAVDLHNDHYLKSGNIRHLVAAQMLRDYVTYLKDGIVAEEQRVTTHKG